MNTWLDYLVNYHPQEKKNYDMTQFTCAVLIILITKKNIPQEILLLKRPDFIASYAGDVCFPGGIKEETDETLKQTAIRETFEEIGLLFNVNDIIGQLNDFLDRRKRLVRPYVVLCEKEKIADIKLDKNEIAEFFLMPVEKLKTIALDIHNIKPSSRKPAYIFQEDEKIIWGLTAAILVHLSNIIDQTENPVGFF